MAEAPEKAHNVQPPDSGRLLTPDEAQFLKQFLLESDPVVVVGRDNEAKDRTHSKESDQ